MAAIDNNGKLYYTLIQANSNYTTFELFLFNFVKILDSEHSGWR